LQIKWHWFPLSMRNAPQNEPSHSSLSYFFTGASQWLHYWNPDNAWKRQTHLTGDCTLMVSPARDCWTLNRLNFWGYAIKKPITCNEWQHRINNLNVKCGFLWLAKFLSSFISERWTWLRHNTDTSIHYDFWWIWKASAEGPPLLHSNINWIQLKASEQIILNYLTSVPSRVLAIAFVLIINVNTLQK